MNKKYPNLESFVGVYDQAYMKKLGVNVAIMDMVETETESESNEISLEIAPVIESPISMGVGNQNMGVQSIKMFQYNERFKGRYGYDEEEYDQNIEDAMIKEILRLSKFNMSMNNAPSFNITTDNVSSLVSSIMMASNWIGNISRRGIAEYVIIDFDTYKELLQLNIPHMDAKKQSINYSHKFYYGGNIGSLDIWVMRSDLLKNTVIVGRSSQPDEPGFKFIPLGIDIKGRLIYNFRKFGTSAHKNYVSFNFHLL